MLVHARWAWVRPCGPAEQHGSASHSGLLYSHDKLPPAAPAGLGPGAGLAPAWELKGASLRDHGKRQQALKWKASTSRRLTWSVTKLQQSRQVTCTPAASGLSQPAHEVGVAGHRVGGSCTNVMTPGCNLLQRRGAVRSWKMMPIGNATSD